MNETSAPRQLDKELLAKLATADRRRVALRAGSILVIYAGTVYLALRPAVGWWAVLFSLFLGFVLSGFINAAHDCVHRAHLRSKRGNRIAGMFWGTPIMLNFTIYRHQHLVHHRFTGVEGDTEPEETFETLRGYLHTFSGIPVWPGLAKRIIRTWRKEFPASVSTDERRRDARLDNWVLTGWLVLMVILTIAFPYALLIAYWLPLAFVVPAIFFLSLPEHYGLWGVPEVTRNTRTIESNSFVRFFVWNANYHAEHHRYPAVASLNLHRLRKALAEPHPITGKSYVGFHAGLVSALWKGNQDYGKRVEPEARPQHDSRR
ncbi:fatty acid desaturase [Streptomyces sp. NPDC044780]|uniref:fatty acid desaturase family protein n=1 Tax=unclassified Streptomyces TaxID=2593676 RepID=UPI00340C44B8